LVELPDGQHHSKTKSEGAVAEIEEFDELPAPDPLPPFDEDSPEYKAGFLAGSAGLPCAETDPEWVRGWADAEE
jgi:hypothetical protein